MGSSKSFLSTLPVDWRRRVERLTCAIWVGLALVSLAACGGGADTMAEEPPVAQPPPALVIAFQLLPQRMSLELGGRTSALAFGNEAAVSWSSSDPSVATVDAAGIVNAVGAGRATITASAAGKTASTPVRVHDPAAAAANATSEALVAAALASGRIDAEQALVFRVFARFGDARLPPEYEGAPGQDNSVLRELQRRLPGLSPSAQQTLGPFLRPPIYLDSWLGVQLGVAPATASSGSSASQRSRALAASDVNCIGTFPGVYKRSTAHFNIATLPHFPTAAATVDRFATMVEDIYAAETTLLNRVPKSDAGQPCDGGDGKVDIYISPLGSNEAETTAYPGACNDTPAFIVVDQLTSDALYGNGNRAQTALLDKHYRNVLAHEFMHVLQFGMNRSAACEDYDWIDDATAEWAMDHVFPSDNVEDGQVAWVTAERPGAFYVNYIVNEHRTSIEKTLGASNGYSDYVFFQFVARTYGSSAIRAIFDAMLTKDSVEAIDAGLQAQGGMKAVWPEFARALWLDRDNDALPSVLAGDGYDFGLSRVFKGEAKSHTLVDPTAHEPVRLDLAGGPRERKILLRTTAVFAEGYVVPPRSFFYEHLKFVDSQISGVVLVNPVGDSDTGAKVEIVKKIDGRWSAPQDITGTPSVEFCRDRRDERIDELLVIVSHGGGQRDAPPLVISDDRPMFVATSNVGCWKWQGEASTRSFIDDGAGNSGELSAQATGLVFERQGDGAFFAGRIAFTPSAGVASGFLASRGVIPPCSTTITGPPHAVSPNDGFLLFGLDLELSPPLVPDRRVNVFRGNTAIKSTSRSVCPGVDQTGSVMNGWAWLAYPLGTNPLEVSADGRTIEADLTLTAEFSRTVHKFKFTAMRE